MKSIPDPRALLKPILNKAPVLLLLDFDGTLSHLVDDPDDACLHEDIKKTLRELAQCSLYLGVVTGRSIQDIRKRIRLKNILYSGDHGFEIKGKEVSFQFPLPSDYKKAIQEILIQIRKQLLTIPGVILQQKKYSTSIHYRMVDSSNLTSFKKKVKGILKPYIKSRRLKLFTGKKVYEIKPPVDWDKGKAIEKIAEELKSRNLLLDHKPVYIGDDVTDEDAFRSVNKLGGVSIRVGKTKKSKAKFYLKNIQDVLNFLRAFLS